MKKALLIGINYNQTPNAKLYGCINDAMAMRNMLVDAYAYETKNITVLRDDVDVEDSLPTGKNIIENIQKLVNESSRLEEIWIHYSGHGSNMSDRNSEEKDGRDEILIPCDYATNGIIQDDTLRSFLDGVKCRMYITMDCCNAGTNWDIIYSFPMNNGRIYRNIENNRRIANKNIYMIAGSRDTEFAADYFNFETRQPMGAFTIGLIDCLRERNHNVSLLTLYRDLTSWLSNNNFTQTCLLSSSNPLPYINIQRSGGSSGRALNVATTTNTKSSSSRAMANGEKYEKAMKDSFGISLLSKQSPSYNIVRNNFKMSLH